MDRRVLLVEDDAELRDTLQDILEYEGFDVATAADGRQALDYLRTTRRTEDAPSLVILDLMMPVLNGWQVLDAMREEPELGRPVIVVSASGGPEPGGVAGYLRKPFNLVNLLDQIHASFESDGVPVRPIRAGLPRRPSTGSSRMFGRRPISRK